MKKLLALVLAVVMVFALGFNAFAVELSDIAGTTNEESIQYFVDNGVINGFEDGTFRPDATLTRAQLAKILVYCLGAQEEADALQGPTAFTDVAATANWASGYINYLVDEELLRGTSATTFGPGNKLTVGHLVTFLLRVLDVEYTEGTGAEWYVPAIEKAVELKLIDETVKGTDAAFRGVAMGIIYKTIDIALADGSTLRSKIEGIDTSELNVVKATATNLVEVNVTFSATLDASTVDASDFTVKGKNSPKYTPVAKEVLEDGKTVRLTMKEGEGFKNEGTYTLEVVSDILSVAGKGVTVKTAEFVAGDFAAPEALSVKYIGPRHMEITFNEPVNSSGGSVYVDNSASSASVAAATNTRTITVTTPKDFATGKHDIKISGFKDAANYQMATKVITEEYTPVTVPVTATLKDINQTSFTLKFSQPVLVKDANKEYFYHTYRSWNPYTLKDNNGNALKANSYYSEIKAEFTKDTYGLNERELPIPEGTAIVGVIGNSEMKDRWGNKVDTIELKGNVTVDKKAPTVTEVKATSATEVEVKFSKAVTKKSAENAANYVLKNADGTVASSKYTRTLNAAGNVVTLTFTGTDRFNGAYSLTVKGIEDTTLAKLPLTEVTINFTAEDLEGIKASAMAVKLSNKVAAVNQGSVIYVKYPEAPLQDDSHDSALYKGNYTITLGHWDAGTSKYLSTVLKNSQFDVDMYNDKIVKITIIDKDQFFGLASATNPSKVWISIGKVADAAGNMPALTVGGTALVAMTFDNTGAGALGFEAAPQIL